MARLRGAARLYLSSRSSLFVRQFEVGMPRLDNPHHAFPPAKLDGVNARGAELS